MSGTTTKPPARVTGVTRPIVDANGTARWSHAASPGADRYQTLGRVKGATGWESWGHDASLKRSKGGLPNGEYEIAMVAKAGTLAAAPSDVVGFRIGPAPAAPPAPQPPSLPVPSPPASTPAPATTDAHLDALTKQVAAMSARLDALAARVAQPIQAEGPLRLAAEGQPGEIVAQAFLTLTRQAAAK